MATRKFYSLARGLTLRQAKISLKINVVIGALVWGGGGTGAIALWLYTRHTLALEQWGATL